MSISLSINIGRILEQFSKACIARKLLKNTISPCLLSKLNKKRSNQIVSPHHLYIVI